MHGLINRSIQCFLRDTYGAETWSAVAAGAALGFDSFETMLTYPPPMTDAVLGAAVHVLGKPRDALLEDLGTYLVTHETMQGLRRLLRFGGVTFHDFLHSLDDLPDRARLALPDLNIPALELLDHSPCDFTLICQSRVAGAGHVAVGLLRAMADDYGVLGLVEHQGPCPGGEIVAISLAATRFAHGRSFALACDLPTGGAG